MKLPSLVSLAEVSPSCSCSLNLMKPFLIEKDVTQWSRMKHSLSVPRYRLKVPLWLTDTIELGSHFFYRGIAVAEEFPNTYMPNCTGTLLLTGHCC